MVDHGYHAVRVKRIVDETSDTRSFVLDVPDELRDAFAYRAGQFCTFRVCIDGRDHLRSYSMSSAPETDPDLTVTVKRVPGGLVSNWLNDHVRPGDLLHTTRPAGVFCAREGSRPVVALCGGSGITPVVSIAKSVLATTDRPVSILYANRSADSVIFADLLAGLAERHRGRLAITHHLDSERGYLGAAEVDAFADAAGIDGDFFICGPAPFMDLVETMLLGLGVAADRIAIERFSPVAPHPTATSVPDTEGPETVTVILGGRKTTVAYRAGDTLLETARRGGLQPPFSCEAGNCATCMAMLRAGSARMRANNALTEDEVADGWVLTCQALPQGPEVTVEYEPL